MTGSLFVSGQGYLSEAAPNPGWTSVEQILKKDDWNDLVVEVYKGVYHVSLNNHKILRHKSKTAKKRGPVGLQLGAGKGRIEFRNIYIGSEKWH